MHHIIEQYSERLVLLIVGISEFVGIQVAIFTPNLSIPLPLMLMWCLVQVIISGLLLFQIWYAFKRFTSSYGVRYAMRESFRFANMALLCIIMQVFGLFHSLQLFGAAVALTDGLFLYRISDYD